MGILRKLFSLFHARARGLLLTAARHRLSVCRKKKHIKVGVALTGMRMSVRCVWQRTLLLLCRSHQYTFTLTREQMPTVCARDAVLVFVCGSLRTNSNRGYHFR